MNLNKTDILVLKDLANAPQKTSSIASHLDLSRGRASTILNKLLKQKIVSKTGWYYQIGNTSQAIAINRLLKNQPALALEKIFTQTEFRTLELLYKKQRTVKELSKEVGKTERNIYYSLETLKSMGLISEFGVGIYIINKQHNAFKDIESILTKTIKTIPSPLESEAFNVAWSGDDEYIIRTRNPEKAVRIIEEAGFKWKYTSTSAAAEYGIHVIPPETIFYIYKKPSNLKIDSGNYVAIEDAIIHSFLEENKSAEDYSKWLIQKNQEKINLAYLKEAANKYDLSKVIDGILYEIKPTLDRVKYNADRILSLLEGLSKDKEENSDFSIASELENYWNWIESFGRGENENKEKEIIELVKIIATYQPPFFKPFTYFFEWKKKKDYRACIKSGQLLLEDALFAFDNKVYWSSIWFFERSAECFKELKDKNSLKQVIEKSLSLVYNQDFPIHYKISLIKITTDNIKNLDSKQKEKILGYLVSTAEEYHKEGINQLSRGYITNLSFERRLLEEALKILRKENNPQLAKDVRCRIGLSFTAEGDLKNVPLISSSHYEDALREFTACGNKSKQSEMKKKIESSLSKATFKEIRMPLTLDLSFYQSYIERLANQKPVKILEVIASDETYIPDWDVASKTSEETAKSAVFMSLIPHEHIRDGKPVSKRATPKEIQESQVKTQFMLDASLKAILYLQAMTHLIENQKINQIDLKEFLEKCKVDNNIAAITSTAFERHLSKDYQSSITLFVTQVESLIRQLLKEEGTATTIPINNEFGLQEAPLGTLLTGISQTQQILGKNFTRYIWIYLCDKEHENIRNKVAHGLMKPYEYTPEVSLRLLWILLYLAMKNRSILKQGKIVA
ncbi:MAG: DUF4209 domain-containing protein [Candidatus Altiarchaeia archaeon]